MPDVIGGGAMVLHLGDLGSKDIITLTQAPADTRWWWRHHLKLDTEKCTRKQLEGWLTLFMAKHGRDPNPGELEYFIDTDSWCNSQSASEPDSQPDEWLQRFYLKHDWREPEPGELMQFIETYSSSDSVSELESEPDEWLQRFYLKHEGREPEPDELMRFIEDYSSSDSSSDGNQRFQ